MAKRIIKQPKVLDKTGWSASTLWEKVRQRRFPGPVKMDPDGRASGWVEDEVDAEIDAAIARRDQELDQAKEAAA